MMDFFTKKYPEEELREYISKNNLRSKDWAFISCYQTLSEDFIREFKDKVHWGDISWNQTLSEDFISEFKDKVHWGDISRSYILSKKFKTEFHEKINILDDSTSLSNNFKNHLDDKIFSINLDPQNNPKVIF